MLSCALKKQQTTTTFVIEGDKHVALRGGKQYSSTSPTPLGHKCVLGWGSGRGGEGG